jgi:hypothetical protein
MDAAELLETIAHLIHQAEQGEIDPWDVQVIEVIDRYLELMAPETTRIGYEADLSQSGQAFLSASMLVLFKANTLMQMQAAADESDVVLDDVLPDNDPGLVYSLHRLPLERALRPSSGSDATAKTPRDSARVDRAIADHGESTQTCTESQQTYPSPASAQHPKYAGSTRVSSPGKSDGSGWRTGGSIA